MFKPVFKYTAWFAVAICFVLSFVFLEIEDSNSATVPQVWAQSSLEHILLDTPAGETRNIHLYAARGEYESFQIAIDSPQQELTITDLTITDLKGMGDRSIARKNITLYREHYVNVTKPSPNWRGSKVNSLGKGWYPDGLIPFVDPQTGEPPIDAELSAVPFSPKQGQNQPFWVDVFIPRDLPADDYRGSYTVSSSLGNFTGQIVVTVWNFELPKKPSLKSAFLSWEQKDKNTMIELLKHRVMPSADIDPQIERELIDEWGFSSVRLPFWSGADYYSCSMTPAPSSAEIRAEGLKHELDLMLYVYATDEIDDCQELLEPLQEWSHNIHQAGIKHLAVMAPIPELYEHVDIWVVDPQRYDAAGKNIAEVLRQGKEIWFYTFFAHGGSQPTWQIDFQPINHRIAQGFINQSLGLTGLLYWRVDTWTDDPWNDVDTNPHPEKPEHYPGEGMLIYPGTQVGIKGSVPSMRLKWIRDGVEDYEYIEVLKRWGDRDWAMATVREVARDFRDWNQDPQVLNRVRQKLGERIDWLSRAT